MSECIETILGCLFHWCILMSSVINLCVQHRIKFLNKTYDNVTIVQFHLSLKNSCKLHLYVLFCCNISVITCFLEHVRRVIGSDFIHAVCYSIMLAKMTIVVCNMYINANGGKIFNLLLSLLREEAGL